MEKRLFYVYIILLTSIACNRTNSPNDTNNNIPTENEGRNVPEEVLNETNVDDDAIGFMKMAGRSGTMEVELGKLAQAKTQNLRIKNFATMMIKDHSRVTEELVDLGSNKNVVVNRSLTTEDKKLMADLKRLSGTDFDRQYMQHMLTGHMKAIESFETAADNRDDQLNKFANKTLPVLRMHLDSVKAIHTSLTNN